MQNLDDVYLTVYCSTLCTTLAISALEYFELHSVDISHSYLNGTLKEEIYMQEPEGLKWADLIMSAGSGNRFMASSRQAGSGTGPSFCSLLYRLQLHPI